MSDQLFLLEPSSLKPSGGQAPYAATAWGNSFVDGLGDFLVQGSPEIHDSVLFFLGGRRVEFVELEDDWFKGPGTPSLYRWGHDGTGMGVGGAFWSDDPDGTQALMSTNNATANQAGLHVRFDGPNARVVFAIYDGSGTPLVPLTGSPNGSAPLDAGNTWSLEFKNRTPGVGGTLVDDYSFRVNGVLYATGELGASQVPSVGDPASVLGIGRRGSSASEYFEGGMYYAAGLRGLYGQFISDYLEGRSA